ncbi:HsdM family class I SAM-dependent methyltransferase, partial [Psittacicella gerlachiana]
MTSNEQLKLQEEKLAKITEDTKKLIDDLKTACKEAGVGNVANEQNIITQLFLYKFLNDKFTYELKKISEIKEQGDNWLEYYQKFENDKDELEFFYTQIDSNIPSFKPSHLIGSLIEKVQDDDFDKLVDKVLIEIGEQNLEGFYTKSTSNELRPILKAIFNVDSNLSGRSKSLAQSAFNALIKFSFEAAFEQHYDFYSTIFEYLVKDYNTNSGSVFAEYYTPLSIATIIARLLTGDKEYKNVRIYDPSAGTGTLLMALSHQIGENRCTIYAQDQSAKSNLFIKLNLIINGLVRSLDNVIQGDTLLEPSFFKNNEREGLPKFDFVVSNPPFNLDFSKNRDTLATQNVRFWAGVPEIPNKNKSSMNIYTLFVQHVVNSLKEDGKGAIVVPTGFLTTSTGI